MSVPDVTYRALGLCLLLLAQASDCSYAQDTSIDLFPRVTLSLSGGLFRPALDELTKDHRKDAMIGAQVSLRLFELFSQHHLYGTVHVYSFHAKRLGSGREVTGGTLSALVKWDMRPVNAGVRYAVRLFKVKEVSWLGGGVSSITLDRNVITSQRVRVNFLDFEEERSVERERFRAVGFYLEVGQMVQSFAFNARPRVGLFWNVKYDGGRTGARAIGGLSIQAGALVGL